MTSLLFFKEHVSYWKKKVTGLSPDITNKQSQVLHLYLYAVGYNLIAQCIRIFKYLTKKLINLFGCHQPIYGFPQPHPRADSVSEWIPCHICFFSFF